MSCRCSDVTGHLTSSFVCERERVFLTQNSLKINIYKIRFANIQANSHSQRKMYIFANSNIYMNELRLHNQIYIPKMRFTNAKHYSQKCAHKVLNVLHLQRVCWMDLSVCILRLSWQVSFRLQLWPNSEAASFWRLRLRTLWRLSQFLQTWPSNESFKTLTQLPSPHYLALVKVFIIIYFKQH